MSQFRSIVLLICLLISASIAGSSERYNDVLMAQLFVSFEVEGLQNKTDVTQFSGEWRQLGMARFCDGHLTSAYEHGFCESEPPSQWESFTYEGQEYFVQPLAENERN